MNPFKHTIEFYYFAEVQVTDRGDLPPVAQTCGVVAWSGRLGKPAETTYNWLLENIREKTVSNKKFREKMNKAELTPDDVQIIIKKFHRV